MRNIKQYENRNDLTFPMKVRVPRQLHSNTELKVALGDDISQR